MKIVIKILLLASFSCQFNATERNLPLQESDIFSIEDSPEIQFNSALLQTGNSSNLVYESWNGSEQSKGSLHRSKLKVSNGRVEFSTPMVIPPDSDNLIRTSVSHVRIEGTDWIYFIESNKFDSDAQVFRAQLKNDTLQKKQMISTEMSISAASNARWNVSLNNEVTMVYTSKECCKLYFSKSKDGVNFSTAVYIGNTGFMPHLASFTDGTLLYLFQKSFRSSQEKPNGKPIFITKTHFRVSNNSGVNWNDSIPLNLTDKTIHDAKALVRSDGKIDIYYVYPFHENNELSLWRRCIDKNGNLGSEELVIDHGIGNLAKPSPHRLRNGKILLSFIDQGGEVTRSKHNIYAAVIFDDASCVVLVNSNRTLF